MLILPSVVVQQRKGQRKCHPTSPGAQECEEDDLSGPTEISSSSTCTQKVNIEP
jgi:hypothetical protein